MFTPIKIETKRDPENMGHVLISRRTFEVNGVKLDEVIFGGGKLKPPTDFGLIEWRSVLLTKHPFEQKEIDGEPNVLAESSVRLTGDPARDELQMADARGKVLKKLREHYGI